MTSEETLQRLLKAREPKAKKIPKPLRKKSLKKQAEEKEAKVVFEQDKVFYKEIWDASPHKCQCGCNAKLGKEPMTTFFHHLLPKARFPQFRHTHENIMILHPDCHNSYHSRSDSRPEVVKRKLAAEKILLQ